MKKYYRISDKGNPFGRIEGYEDAWFQKINRINCFDNFIKMFGTDELIVVADNANQSTIDYIRNRGLDVIETSLGNTKSFKFVLDKAIQDSTSDEDIAYFIEDDYLHLPGGENLIVEALNYYPYVSLFDHLDKYIDNGNNPLIRNRGEDTKVVITKSSHWKYTNATTMTFAAKIKTLRADYDLFMRYCQDHFPHPQDFAMFRELIEIRGRILVTPIPGKSSHIGYEMSPFIEWKDLV